MVGIHFFFVWCHTCPQRPAGPSPGEQRVAGPNARRNCSSDVERTVASTTTTAKWVRFIQRCSVVAAHERRRCPLCAREKGEVASTAVVMTSGGSAWAQPTRAVGILLPSLARLAMADGAALENETDVLLHTTSVWSKITNGVNSV